MGLAIFGCLPAVHATPILFVTGPITPTTALNASTGGTGPIDVSASFSFNTTTQQITIGLLNLLAQDGIAITGVPQAISGIEFTLGNTGTGITSTYTPLTVTETGGTYIDINSKTSTTLASPQPANGWQAAELAPRAAGGGPAPTYYPAIGNNTLTLCTICNPNGTGIGGGLTGNPTQMLVSGPSDLTTDAYGNANGSLTAGGHQPLLLASGATYSGGVLNGKNSAPVWTVQLPANSLLATTTITSVTFYFGSLYYEYDAVGDSPEPATNLLMLSGLLLTAWFGRKRLVRKA